MGKGQELYKKAKRLIPGGTMLIARMLFCSFRKFI